jgi:ABC-type antimicrobial peptide transport system permease subunit
MNKPVHSSSNYDASVEVTISAVIFCILTLYFFVVTIVSAFIGVLFMTAALSSAQGAVLALICGYLLFLPGVAVLLLLVGLALPRKRYALLTIGIVAHLIVIPAFILYFKQGGVTAGLIQLVLAVVYSLTWWRLVSPKLTSTQPPVSPTPKQ